jgi:hypothetical protein
LDGKPYGEFDVYNRNGNVMFHVKVNPNDKWFIVEITLG